MSAHQAGGAAGAAPLTRQCAEFVATLRFDDLPEEAIVLSKRCVLDGIGVAVAGTTHETLAVLRRFLHAQGGHPQARPLADRGPRLPVARAALWNGVAGHVMDWDDSQLAEHPGRVYGRMCHPTVPPLAAALAVADHAAPINGPRFLEAFLAGFEIECKLAEAIDPAHYQNGWHTSGTMGTFAAAAAAAKLLGADAAQLRRTFGIAASLAAGVKVNHGTMVKSLHVGRAAENGVTAALLAMEGFTAAEDAFDGQYNYLDVAGGGANREYALGRLGRPFSIVAPGVSVKPYPCGVLSHPSMDMMLALAREHDLGAGDIDSAKLYAGDNVLKPIRFRLARDELEAKFCMPFLLAAMVIAGRAGRREFSADFVRRDDVQALQRRIETVHDPAIEAEGFDRIRSRLEVRTTDGRVLVREAGPYRGGPQNPLSDEELAQKFRDCTEGLMATSTVEKVIDRVYALEREPDVSALLDALEPRVAEQA